MSTGIAIVGCGFVADYYASTLPLHPQLTVRGVFDRIPERATTYAQHHGLHRFGSLDEALSRDDIDIVVNLTNPRSHADVTRAALEAGKHVYSEKPIAMDIATAAELVDLAERRGLHLSSAPCSVLGETAQTVWHTVRSGALGDVRVVYAEMDEGMVFRMPYRRWASASGAQWPYRDEFEVGTVIEHAGYVVSWLPAMFGAAREVAGFSTCVFPDKGSEAESIPVSSPDLAVACITFDSGVVARLTCSLVAPHDHSLRVVGDRGVLTVDDTWYYQAPVRMRRWFHIRGRHVEHPFKKRFPLVAKGQNYSYKGTQQMDFARGVADLADALREDRSPRLSSRYSLHVNEIVLAVSNSLAGGGTYAMTTKPGPIAPMSWAEQPAASSRVRRALSGWRSRR